MNSTGFSIANSINLPRVDSMTVAEFFASNSLFSAAKIRGVKANSAGRESYGDAAVGQVEVKRKGNICTVQCEICPEHHVHNKNYTVRMRIDEDEEKVIDVECLDCAASLGGCKHAVAFLMWVHR